jgi:luciferase family oxidoreductase group 1
MTSSMPRLSVLDLVPVRSDQTTSDALAASVSLAKRADALGYHRYWVAEHHNMQAVAATNPPVLIAMLAAVTKRIRVGSGGVMLPNHAPLVIAEQFAAIEAAFPGRIDLGIGRAPGSDPVITALLRSTGTTSEVDRFPENVQDILALLNPDGATLRIGGGREYEVRATPRAVSIPDLWLLGSSDYSATLAATLGLPYVFAHHFSGEGTQRALDLYRGSFTPGVTDAPRTFLTVNAVVADTEQEARELAVPQLLHMARLRSGLPLTAQSLVEDALAEEVAVPQQSIMDTMAERWVIGTRDQAADGIRKLAERFAVDEVMIAPVAAARRGTDARTSPARERTLELLSEKLQTFASE